MYSCSRPRAHAYGATAVTTGPPLTQGALSTPDVRVFATVARAFPMQQRPHARTSPLRCVHTPAVRGRVCRVGTYQSKSMAIATRPHSRVYGTTVIGPFRR